MNTLQDHVLRTISGRTGGHVGPVIILLHDCAQIKTFFR
jgi:hypothetical protein